MDKTFRQKVNKDFCWSVTKSCLILCDPMDCNMPDITVLHSLPEFAPTHVHWVGDAIQPSHPLQSPAPPALDISQHRGLFQLVGCSYQAARYDSVISQLGGQKSENESYGLMLEY